jgi:hypothetical protein
MQAWHRPIEVVGELPEAYGTERLYLAARDPNWLYAAWDLTSEQQQQHNAKSKDRHLIVRVYSPSIREEPAFEAHVHPESKSWFIHVGRGRTQFVAQLGYYEPAGQWHSIATSRPALTPPESPAPALPTEFASLPSELKLPEAAEAVRQAHQAMEPSRVAVAETPAPLLSEPTRPAAPVAPATVFVTPDLAAQEFVGVADSLPPAAPVPEQSHPTVALYPPPSPAGREDFGAGAAPHRHEARVSHHTELRPVGHPPKAKELPPLLEALQQLRIAGWTGVPDVQRSRAPEWTVVQAEALHELIPWERSWIGQIGSLPLQLEERGQRLVRRELLPSSAELLQVSKPGERGAKAPVGGPGAVSSPLGEEARVVGGAPGFWFKVNAELIIYGSTEPTARVELDGRDVRIRPDGTFSFRFALPDGWYPLQVRAISADGADSRSAHLEFSRGTYYQGEVGVHPQDLSLKAPNAVHWE